MDETAWNRFVEAHMDFTMVVGFDGRPIDEMDRDELRAVIRYLIHSVQSLRRLLFLTTEKLDVSREG